MVESTTSPVPSEQALPRARSYDDSHEMLVLDVFEELQRRVVQSVITSERQEVELLFRFAVPRLFRRAAGIAVPSWEIKRCTEGYSAVHESGARWAVTTYDNMSSRRDEHEASEALDLIIATPSADGLAPPPFASLVSALFAATGIKDPSIE